MMLPLAPRTPEQGDLELLCIGAHSDDLEIGCGGTVLRLLRELPVSRLTWVVLSGSPDRAEEARQGARRVFGRRRGTRIVQAAFRDGFFPYTGGAIKEFFEVLKSEVKPDLILTHYRHDLHQDHRVVSELTYNTFRDHLIFEYEIMKLDGDFGNPNVYVPLDTMTVRRKISLLLDSFGTQRDKRWFSEETFRGLMRLRGMEAGSSSGYAEAFYGRKLVMFA
jgi:LmbE family N-acetylglucosaminyl deacetylase